MASVTISCVSVIPTVCRGGSVTRSTKMLSATSSRQSLGSVALTASKSQTRKSACKSILQVSAAAAAGGYVQFKQKATVVLTREKGNNGKLAERLNKLGLETLEMPLIEHAHADGFESLPTVLKSTWDWVLITSPEAAKTFLEGWEQADKPKVRIAVVGKGTADTFKGVDGLEIGFMPSKATGKVLAAELPVAKKGETVLYACSAKAGNDVQDGLTARGFTVTRLDTYTTQNVASVEPGVLAQAKQADIVTFASPSTIKAWVNFMGDHALNAGAPRAACIGETSATASRNAGLQKVFFPEKPGIDGWVNSVLDALKSK